MAEAAVEARVVEDRTGTPQGRVQVPGLVGGNRQLRQGGDRQRVPAHDQLVVAVRGRPVGARLSKVSHHRFPEVGEISLPDPEAVGQNLGILTAP